MNIKPNEESGNKKFLIAGLDNSGKTSIVLSMKGENNLLSYYSISPTQKISIEKVPMGNINFLLWEAGGQLQYRNLFIDNFDQYSENVDKFLFVIDIQDKKRYDEAVDYLSQILVNFKKKALNPEIILFFHKFDPAIEGNPDYSDQVINQTLLSKIIKIIPDRKKVEFFKSTIYTIFKKTPLRA
jgi:GTPase SAR1 family protein